MLVYKTQRAMNQFDSSKRGVAQLVAYLNGVQVVAGSSPVAPILKKTCHLCGRSFFMFNYFIFFCSKKKTSLNSEVFLGLRYYVTLTNLSIGMKTAITIPPITIPRTTITNGSITEVRPLTAVSTSVS